EFELLPGVAESIREFNAAGFLVIVVTNQPVVARGEVSFTGLEDIHKKMETLLGQQGAYVDGIYVCPHHPDRGFAGEISELKIDCDCRKPKPGLILRAAEDFNIDLAASWMVGDSARDIECGRNAGCHTALLTGEGTFFDALGKQTEVLVAEVVCNDMKEFCDFLRRE
ncbi:MAG: HAD family hydrolase, partial [Selenomonas sp.]|nr:HAD family hydrolase [Selenomonas sp.]